MIAVICSIIAVILIGGVAGYLLYKKFANRITDKVEHTSHPVDQSSKVDSISGSPDVLADDMFQDQYHPRADFDIFGHGDPFKKKN